MQPSSSRRNDQTENIGDHGRVGNTSYNQGNTHNLANQQRHGTMNTNYRNTQSSLMNTGTSTGTMKTWNEMVEKRLNSSQDACFKEGVMSRFICFFPFYLPNRDSGRLDRLSTPALGVPMLSLRCCMLGCSVSHEQLIFRPSHFSI